MANAGQVVKVQVKVKNVSPAKQAYSLTDAIPAGTSFVKGKHYNGSTNSIEWTGKLKPNQTKTFNFWVRVDKALPSGTVIVNDAFLMDDASGAQATVNITVK